MHAHLNHMGSDLARGLLTFGEGRPLGETGLRWLYIHVSGLLLCTVCGSTRACVACRCGRSDQAPLRCPR